MKLNFIVDESNQTSVADANILSFLFKKIKDKTDIKMIDIKNFKCDNASINIFFGVINNLFLDNAKCNILIPNQHEFYKEWVPYLNNFDLVIAKTLYIEELLKQYISPDKIKYLCWRSTDINNNYEKDFNEFFMFCYDSKYTNYKKIIQNWDEDFPNLNLVYGFNDTITKIQKNIIYHKNLDQQKYENLFNKCGVHICLNEIDSFNHNINQCCLSKSIPIIANGIPMKENKTTDIYFHVNSKKKNYRNF